MHFLMISIFSFALALIDAKTPPEEKNMHTVAPVKTISYNSNWAMVKLNIYENGQCKVCSGSFVNPKWILTSAHCVHDAQSVTAQVGYHFNSSCAMTLALNKSDIIIHPAFKTEQKLFGYIPKRSHNIALIKFNAETSCDTIWLSQLPNNTVQKESYFDTSGSFRRFEESCNARTPRLTVLWFYLNTAGSDHVCDYLSPLRHIRGLVDEDQVCVYTSYIYDICDGDTGGQIVKLGSPELIGLMTLTPGISCSGTENAVFTLVSFYVEWIRSHFTDE